MLKVMRLFSDFRCFIIEKLGSETRTENGPKPAAFQRALSELLCDSLR